VRNRIRDRVQFLNANADVRVLPSDENFMIAHHTARLAFAEV
jgi:hypothetical protein